MNLSKHSVDKELFSEEQSSKENTEKNCNDSVSSSLFLECKQKKIYYFLVFSFVCTPENSFLSSLRFDKLIISFNFNIDN